MWATHQGYHTNVHDQGLAFAILLSGFNQFFFFRFPSVSISGFVAVLISLPMGRAWAAVCFHPIFRGSPDPVCTQIVPNWRILGVSLNPGPFTIKEHVLLTIMATVSAGCTSVILLHSTSSDRFYKQRHMQYVPGVFTLAASDVLYLFRRTSLLFSGCTITRHITLCVSATRLHDALTIAIHLLLLPHSIHPILLVIVAHSNSRSSFRRTGLPMALLIISTPLRK